MDKLPIKAILVLVSASIGILAAFVGAVYALVLFVESCTSSATFSPLSVRIALNGAFLVGALLLYAIKHSRYQFAYGILEVAVGLVSNWGSLSVWFHPAGPGVVNVIYARLTILAVGTYLMGRGVTNVVKGFHTFFPVSWPLVRDAWLRGWYTPRNVRTKDLKRQIAFTQSRIDKLEKKLQVVIQAGEDAKPIQKRIDLMREELQIATERYEKEVLGKELEAEKD
jgi:hypothetical protein